MKAILLLTTIFTFSGTGFASSCSVKDDLRVGSAAAGTMVAGAAGLSRMISYGDIELIKEEIIFNPYGKGIKSLDKGLKKVAPGDKVTVFYRLSKEDAIKENIVQLEKQIQNNKRYAAKASKNFKHKELKVREKAHYNYRMFESNIDNLERKISNVQSGIGVKEVTKMKVIKSANLQTASALTDDLVRDGGRILVVKRLPASVGKLLKSGQILLGTAVALGIITVADYRSLHLACKRERELNKLLK